MYSGTMSAIVLGGASTIGGVGLTGVIVDITTTLANLGAPHPDDQAQARIDAAR